MSASTVQTIELGLIGYPLAHSLSPKLHTAALQACGLAGGYALYPVPPDSDSELKAALDLVRSAELAGLNVTIPHKQTVIPYLDRLTPAAAAIGAVNTIYLRDGQLVGDNTDAPGFLAALEATLLPKNAKIVNRKSQIVNRKSALVLGAGGAARAVVYALTRSGWDVGVAARRQTQSAQLAKDFAGIQALEMSPRTYENCRAQLIVNTTPLGMHPEVETTPWPPNLPLPAGAMIYDLVYSPRETMLVKRARTEGLSAASGLGMLIEQAALAFEIWTGQDAPRAVMLQAADQFIFDP